MPRLATAIRMLLAGFTLAVIAWSFANVGWRAVERLRVEAERPITLRILHWGDPAENQIVQSLVDQYMREHPQVRIVRIHASDFDSKLKTMMAAGDAPDLFYLPPRMLPELASLELIRPIDDYVEQEIGRSGREWFDDYFPKLIQTYRFDVDKQRVGTGPLYGLPKDFTPAVFYVNVDLWKRAGLERELHRIQEQGWTWKEFDAIARKLRALGGDANDPDNQTYGAVFELWPETIRQMLWSFGGEFFGARDDGSADFRDVTLDTPESLEALHFIRRLRLDDRTAHNVTGIAKDGAQEFVAGKIGMAGPVGRWKVPRYRTIESFKWDIVPVPHQEGLPPVSQLFTNAWTISSQTEHPEEAFKLMLHLSGGEGARQQSRLGLAIPPQKSIAYSDDFLHPPGIPEHRADLFLKAADTVRVQQIPRPAEWDRILGDRITRSIQGGQATPEENVKEIKDAWLAVLDSPLQKREYAPVRWDWVLGAGGAVLAAIVGLLVWKIRRERLGPLDRAQERAGYAFIMPWLIGFLALTLGPMLLSLLLSFTKWSAMVPISQARFVGDANFTQMIGHDQAFYDSLGVTVYYVLLAVPIGQVCALAIAMLMNSNVRGIAIFRTIYFVPSVVAGAALAVLWLQIYNNEYGLMNEILRPLLSPFGLRPPNWFGVDPVSRQNDSMWWAIPGFVIMSLWGVGAGMIIYLAGLKGIPKSLYEAATIDGAGSWRRFWNVTLPMLSPLIFYNLVMGIIGSFQVFTQAYMMTGAGVDNSTLFYVLQLYRHAFEFHNMGYASAMAWILFVICLILTLLVFRGSRNLVYYEGLRT